MTRPLRCFTLLLTALLSWACESEDQCLDSGISGPGAPQPPLDGTWEGREAPRSLDEPSPSWRFELGDDSAPSTFLGTFATDRAIVEGWVHPDTLRGPVSARHCYDEQEMVLEFELRYPRSSDPDDYYTHPCTISGKLQGGNWRIDGLLTCHRPTGLTTRRAIYLIRESS